MKISKQQVIDELDLVAFGSKGWMQSSDTPCPICGKKDKFGILFLNEGGVTHCFYNCGENMSLFNYLKHIGRTDLVEYEREVSINAKLFNVYKEETPIEEEPPEIKLPKGYERVYFDKYLADRNFRSTQYEQFEVGVTHHFLEKRLWNYLIFVLRQKGKVVGWLARSKYSKDWHKKNHENYKLGKEDLVLRYRNSTGVDFEKILGSIDQITPRTETVVAVEGIFDMANISSLLRTDLEEELKVVFTFGDKFSDHQIALLRETSVKNVILMYDSNTIVQSKRYSMELSKYFNVDVCFIDDPTVDPGNMDAIFLEKILKNRKNYLYFYSSKVCMKLKHQ